MRHRVARDHVGAPPHLHLQPSVPSPACNEGVSQSILRLWYRGWVSAFTKAFGFTGQVFSRNIQVEDRRELGRVWQSEMMLLVPPTLRPVDGTTRSGCKVTVRA